MEPFLEAAARNTRRAEAIIERFQLEQVWREAGIEVRRVGSLAMGLLMKHRDIDLHLYSAPVDIGRSFAVVARLAQTGGVEAVSFANRLATDERCIEWHLTLCDDEGERWSIDMIHIETGSRYDGYFERMAARIAAALTPETRRTILQLKWETPDDEHIPGIAYYMAVLRDGVRSMPAFRSWLHEHPLTGIVEWIP